MKSSTFEPGLSKLDHVTYFRIPRFHQQQESRNREDLLVRNRTHLFLVVFYLPRKYDIMFEKVADQGPHTVVQQCTKQGPHTVVHNVQNKDHIL